MIAAYEVSDFRIEFYTNVVLVFMSTRTVFYIKINFMGLLEYFVKINNTFVCLRWHKGTAFNIDKWIVIWSVACTF